MVGWSLTAARLAAVTLCLLGILVFVGQSSSAEAGASVPKVFRTMRAVVHFSGSLGPITPLYGGNGMSITLVSVQPNQYQVDFPVGTWTNPKTAKPCYFVPILSSLQNQTDGTSIKAYAENSDGSGTITLIAPGDWSFLAESANC